MPAGGKVTANFFVNGIGLIWALMMVLSIVVPIGIGIGSDDDGRWAWMFLAAILLQAYALIPAITAMILRLVLDKRLTGRARWFGFVPASVSSAVLLLASIAGWIVGD